MKLTIPKVGETWRDHIGNYIITEITRAGWWGSRNNNSLSYLILDKNILFRYFTDTKDRKIS